MRSFVGYIFVIAIKWTVSREYIMRIWPCESIPICIC